MTKQKKSISTKELELKTLTNKEFIEKAEENLKEFRKLLFL